MSGVEGRSGPPGNKNSTADKRAFANAVRRAALANDGEAIRAVVDKLFAIAKEGDVQAIKEVADRLDGKAKQQTEITGADEGPLVIQWNSGGS